VSPGLFLYRCCLLTLLLLAPVPATADLHRCDWVYDGDTIRLAGGERVRLLGVDTPEVHHPERGEEPFGREALEFTLALAGGSTVELRYHEGTTIGGAQRDKYGRVLAYVWVDGGPQGRVCLNMALIEAGLARATRAWAHPRYDAYVRAEAEARARGAGLWAGWPERAAKTVLITTHGKRYHRPGCPHLEGRKTRALTLADAEKLGRTACRRCRP